MNIKELMIQYEKEQNKFYILWLSNCIYFNHNIAKCIKADINDIILYGEDQDENSVY